jgi:hypothetical protein
MFSYIAQFSAFGDMASELLDECFKMFQKDDEALAAKLSDIQTILVPHCGSMTEALRAHSSRATSQTQVALVSHLCKSSSDNANFEASREGLLTKLQAENFKVPANTPYVLELLNFFSEGCEKSGNHADFLEPMLEHSKNYICSPQSYLNSPAYFQKAGNREVTCHLKTLEVCLLSHF